MPARDEGDLLYMPTTDPISVTKSKELLQQTDKVIATFPEVQSVHGKIGRARQLRTRRAVDDRDGRPSSARTSPSGESASVKYFFSDWPAWVKWPLTHTFWPEERPITTEELKYGWTDPDGTTHKG